jgi:exodeoxyribonuclease VII large subunit
VRDERQGRDGAVPVVRVSELNAAVRKTLEREFPMRWVAGEISTFTKAASGHWYFQLKDERAQIRCVMFRNRNALVDFTPREGLAVEALGVVTLYEARGDFQLGVEALREAGLGALYEAYERLKRRLEAEGLFAPERKRALPAFPRRVGVITSLRAAALHDVLTTLRRRAPHVQVVVYPTPVQGEGAGTRIALALAEASRRAECDVIVLCRGGGSIEDLWSFNEEAVARAIHACAIPVVCGVGHETDVTIADFVADRRAPTPTAAAELVAPARDALLSDLREWRQRLDRCARRAVEGRSLHLDHLARRLGDPSQRIAAERVRLRHLAVRLRQAGRGRVDARRARLDLLARRLVDPMQRIAAERIRARHLAVRLRQAARSKIDARRARLDLLTLRLKPRDTAPLRARLAEVARRLDAAWQGRMAATGPRLAALAAALEHLNPQAVLARGYSLTRTGTGTIVRDSAQVVPGQRVELVFAKGTAAARVDEVRGTDGD